MSDTPSTSAADKPAASDRDAKGRFVAGNKAGPGNPFARRCAQLRSALMDCVADQDVALIAQALVEKAKKGDVPAAKLVLAYTVGKPAEAVSPDRLDIEEWQIFRATAPMFHEMPAVIKAPSPDVALDLTREMRPVVTEAMRHQVGEILKDQVDALKSETKPPSTKRCNGKKRRQRPASASSAPRPAWLNLEEWFAGIGAAPPSPNGPQSAPSPRP